MCYGNLNEPNYPAEKAERLAHKESFEDENLQDDESNLLDAQVRRREVSVMITDFDIATIEALHDLLLDKHGYTLDHITLTNARKLTAKMYEAFKSV
jgi:regulator of sirC expression with transglutaminase-like and TPR domain